MSVSGQPDDSAGKSDENSAEETDRRVGARIRLVRQARGLSLKSASGRTGISIGLLSQIERGQSSASIKALRALADVLNVEIEEFFAEDGAETALRGALIIRLADRRSIDAGTRAVVKEWLTPRPSGPGLDLYMLRLGPGAEFTGRPLENLGIRTGVVLEGGMELELDDQVYLLGVGDSFTFPSLREHRVRNAGGPRTTIIWARHITDALPEPEPALPTDDPEDATQQEKEPPDDKAMEH